MERGRCGVVVLLIEGVEIRSGRSWTRGRLSNRPTKRRFETPIYLNFYVLIYLSSSIRVYEVQS